MVENNYEKNVRVLWGCCFKISKYVFLLHITLKHFNEDTEQNTTRNTFNVQ